MFKKNELNKMSRESIYKQMIENYSGIVEIPVGIVRDALINNETFSIPLATTEAALVASLSRGVKALNLIGGVKTTLNYSVVNRSPVLFCKCTVDANLLKREVDCLDIDYLNKQIISKISKHTTLKSIRSIVVGQNVFTMFVFDTGKASGQNMSTKCSSGLVKHILNTSKVSILSYALESNMAGDKSLSISNSVGLRGTNISAVVEIPEYVMQNVFHVSIDYFLQCIAISRIGFDLAGGVGYNNNFSNVIAAIFTATGQDIACITESSFGSIAFYKVNDMLKIDCILPCLMIGTFGGGTIDGTYQNEYLKLITNGKFDKYSLASVIITACIALELSLTSSMITNTFSLAHQKFGSKRFNNSKL